MAVPSLSATDTTTVLSTVPPDTVRQISRVEPSPDHSSSIMLYPAWPKPIVNTEHRGKKTIIIHNRHIIHALYCTCTEHLLYKSLSNSQKKKKKKKKKKKRLKKMKSV